MAESSTWIEHNTKLWAFLEEMKALCDKYDVFLDRDFTAEISTPIIKFGREFICQSNMLFEKVDLFIKDDLKDKTMGTIKKVWFTDIKNGTTKQISVGEIGHHVFELTRDTMLMNMAIRALTKHDSCEHELFKIEVIREKEG